MKPKTDAVMTDIIKQIRERFPFAMSEEALCADTCSHGCAKKLMEYLNMELIEWEQRLADGEAPDFGDIEKLTKSAKKIYTVLEKNNLVGFD